MENHSRDYAEQELNRWFDAMGVEQEYRTENDVDEFGDKTNEDDSTKERVLKEIMNGRIIVNDSDDLEYTLKDPIMKGDSPFITKLTTCKRYRDKEFVQNMQGVSQKDIFGIKQAKVACIFKKSRAEISLVQNRDIPVLDCIMELFTRAER